MELIPIQIALEPRRQVLVKENDERLIQLEQLIQAKRSMLLDKQKKIKKLSKQNEFLENIKSDYFNYYKYIVQQKQDQVRALEILNKYIDDLKISGKLSKQNIEDTKYEQKKILNELNNIKKGLDKIIEDVDYSKLKFREKNIH